MPKASRDRSLVVCLILSLGIMTMASTAFAQTTVFTPTEICDLKVDNDGDCVVDTPPSGDPVSVEGVVIAWKQFGARGAGAIWDPATKCCISIFDITDAPDFPEGQWVRVEGWVGNFAGLLEIVDEPGVGTDPIVTDLGMNYGAVPPLEMQAGDLADFSAFAEFEESCLIEICGTFQTTDTHFGANTNYDFKGVDGNTATVRIDADTDIVGQPIETDVVTVVGVLGQFNGFTDTCIGYQVLPRQITDIEKKKCGPVSTEAESFGGVKSKFEDED